MKYRIVIEASADFDMRTSFDWGVEVWGQAQARAWFRQTIREIKTLARLPERYPMAPEVEEFSESVRQMIIGRRYRALCTSRGREVHILHVRGPFVDDKEITEENDQV